jgi:hypothetical protein
MKQQMWLRELTVACNISAHDDSDRHTIAKAIQYYLIVQKRHVGHWHGNMCWLGWQDTLAAAKS